VFDDHKYKEANSKKLETKSKVKSSEKSPLQSDNIKRGNGKSGDVISEAPADVISKAPSDVKTGSDPMKSRYDESTASKVSLTSKGNDGDGTQRHVHLYALDVHHIPDEKEADIIAEEMIDELGFVLHADVRKRAKISGVVNPLTSLPDDTKNLVTSAEKEQRLQE
jgi:hypothetical protein